MADASLGLAFGAGLLGAGHCLRMCGGLVCGVMTHCGRKGAIGSSLLAYHATRIMLYTLIGAAAAATGEVLVETGRIGKAQGILNIIAGAAIILIAIHGLYAQRKRSRVIGKPNLLQRASAWLERLPAATAAFAGGAVNGLVPCALIFSMAIKAAAAPSPASGALLLFVFGLGTLPAMGFASFLAAALGNRAQGVLAGAIALVVFLLGLLTLRDGIVFFQVMRTLANG